MSIWEVLGIAPTTDKAAIRHAYAQKTRTCHPEEDPEGFDALHKAFTAAMRAARQGPGMAVMEPQPEAAPVPAQPAQQESGWAARSAAAKAARAARRAAEQQAVEQYASRAQRRAGRIIQLGQGEQEAGQQFDFAAVDAAPVQEAQTVQATAQPSRPLTYEERAWCNDPAPVEQQCEQQAGAQATGQQTAQPQRAGGGNVAQPGKGWRSVTLVLFVLVVVTLVAGKYIWFSLVSIALAWCGMQGANVDWNNPRHRHRILGLWGVGIVGIPILSFVVLAMVWGLHGASDATLDYAVGAIFLNILVAPFGLCSSFLAKKRAEHR